MRVIVASKVLANTAATDVYFDLMAMGNEVFR